MFAEAFVLVTLVAAARWGGDPTPTQFARSAPCFENEGKAAQAAPLERNKARKLFYWGIADGLVGDYDDAIQNLTEFIRSEPKEPIAWVMRGWVRARTHDYDQALLDFTEALRLAPNNAGVYLHRGLAYYQKSDYDRAILDFTAALRLNPQEAQAYAYRGHARIQRERLDEAFADYTAALQLVPQDVDTRVGLALIRVYRGEYDQARMALPATTYCLSIAYVLSDR
jgi:tetratricopeptide (TPR) repeat protein